MKRSKWKGPIINSKNVIIEKKNQKILSRNVEIVPSFIGLSFFVYNGKNYDEIIITNNMVNHKIGEFSFTRKKFSFKKQKSNKK